MAKKSLDEELQDYNAMFIALKDIVDEIPHELLTVQPKAQAWSIKELVCHLVDAELYYTHWMKKVIAENGPSLQAFDQDKWAKNLHYTAWDLQEAILLFGILRNSMGHILANLPAAAWRRSGTHEEKGTLTLRKLLENANNHCKHHLAQILARKMKLQQ
jgi:uncharacterized damage-inducible protein DinB